jgi:hypothetical protein
VGIRREDGLRGAEREENAHVERVERVQVVPARVRRLYMACVAGRERVFCEVDCVDCRADVSGLCLSCRSPAAVLPLSRRRLVAVLSSDGDLRGGRTEGQTRASPMQPKSRAQGDSSAQPSTARSFCFG